MKKFCSHSGSELSPFVNLVSHFEKHYERAEVYQ